MSEATVQPVVNIADVALPYRFAKGGKYAARFGRVGPAIGMKKLGCSMYVVPPGKAAWPRHAHHAVEEMYLILDGTGEFRLGAERFDLKSGDVIAAPAGGADVAHQVINTGTDELRYLAISTMDEPDVIEYPDSGKFRLVSMTRDGNPRTARILFHGRVEDSLDYWDGE